MRDNPLEWIEKHRVSQAPFTSDRGDLFGAFIVPVKGSMMKVISSGECDGRWQHVSVSLEHRTPNWDEMCRIKRTFWDEDEIAVQYHPPASEYKNDHKYCLHMWRPPEGFGILLPPFECV